MLNPNVIFRGLGVMIHEKTGAKNLVTLPFKFYLSTSPTPFPFAFFSSAPEKH
jgi:hypothetical protein